MACGLAHALHPFLPVLSPSTSTQHTDRRNMPRFRRRLMVEFRGDDGELHMGYSHDVSPHGIFVVTRSAPRLGLGVRLWVDIHQHELLELRGRVIWSRRSGNADLQRLVPGGFGLRIEQAPERWYGFLADQMHQG